MTIYRGLGGVNREVKQQFRGLGGVNREVKEQYRGLSGVNRKVFSNKFDIDINDGRFLNHTKTLLTPAETVDGSEGFKIVGRPNLAYNVVTYGDLLIWEYDFNLTGVTYLKFYAKKVVNHGCMAVYMDCPTSIKKTDNGFVPYTLLEVGYSILPTYWTQYTIDVSALSGIHKVGIMGGYFDGSGSTASETQICKIELL